MKDAHDDDAYAMLMQQINACLTQGVTALPPLKESRPEI